MVMNFYILSNSKSFPVVLAPVGCEQKACTVSVAILKGIN